jgi:hypothetical protein
MRAALPFLPSFGLRATLLNPQGLPGMPTNRTFFSQEAVDRWLAEGRVSFEGEQLALLPDGPSFQLTGAVLFVREVVSGEDPRGLCGKVKSVAALEEMQGEHAPGSVVLGEEAWEVTEGFLGDPAAEDAERALAGLQALMRTS